MKCGNTQFHCHNEATVFLGIVTNPHSDAPGLQLFFQLFRCDACKAQADPAKLLALSRKYAQKEGRLPVQEIEVIWYDLEDYPPPPKDFLAMLTKVSPSEADIDP